MTIPDKLRLLVETYEPIADPLERMALVVESGGHPGTLLPEAKRNEETRIRGCVSAAWISGELHEGASHFRCAADSPLVQGLLACLCSFFSGLPASEVAASDEDPLATLGLTRNLSPTRQNGLRHARERIREIARSLA
ncbi:MAG: SufE family protein [Opitutaceae bacterium]|jgi:cysteine desulfuration protein SufE